MPRRRNYKRKRSYRGKSAYKYRRVTGNQRGYVRTGGNYGRYNNGRKAELKYGDTKLLGQVISISGLAVGTLNKIPQTAGPTGRIGQKVRIKNINIRVEYYLPPISTTFANAVDTVRFILYVDRQCNGAVLPLRNLIESPNVFAHRHMSEIARVRVLRDKTIVVGPSPTAANGYFIDVREFFTMNVNCDIPLEFSSDLVDGQIATVRSNNIGIWMISANGLVKCTLEARVRYSDF